MTAAPENGAELLILRDVPYKQETRYIDGDPMPAPLLERNLDALTMMCQQLEEQCARAVAVDMFSASNPSEIIGKVEDLYADKDNLDLLINNMSSVKTDAENIGVIKTAANNIGAVQTASGSIEAVKTVSDAVNDVVLCAAEIAAIKDAPTKASEAATKASEAAASALAAAQAQEQVEFIASFEELFGGTFGDDTDNEIFGGNL